MQNEKILHRISRYDETNIMFRTIIIFAGPLAKSKSSKRRVVKNVYVYSMKIRAMKKKPYKTFL